MIPFYDMVETIEISNDRFDEKFSYVRTANKNAKGLLIAFAVLTGVFFIITLVAIIVCVRKRNLLKMESAENKFNQETENEEG
jgi:preprotein translocase subunit SecG